MPRDKTISHIKIIQAAMDEFREYGYDKASMRRIGDRCGLTAAALYRHFDSKEAMFEALVEPAVADLNDWVKEHMASIGPDLSDAVSVAAAENYFNLWNGTEIDLMRELIYPRMEEYSMLVNSSRGSRYENFLNDLVCEHQDLMMPFFEALKDKGYNVVDLSYEELHILLTAYYSALVEPIAHGYTLEEALRYLSTIEEFFAPGWKRVMGVSQ